MKKFLTPCIFFFFALFSVSAQKSSTSNFLTLSTGPNYFFQNKPSESPLTKYEGGWGYTLGLEYARKISSRLRFHLGAHYNLWQSSVKVGPLQFPSENVNGQYVYDPTLQHYFSTVYKDKAWQIMAGAGWYSNSAKWQWNLGLEMGNTMIQPENKSESIAHRFTAGISAGTALRILPHFQWFLQPAAQRIFVNNPAGSFMVAKVETGLRYQF